MMGCPHASVLAFPHVFASLMLLVAAHAFASADSVSNALQASQPTSIEITLSNQADAAIRLEARDAPLGQILKAIADKTGVNIHYSVVPEAPVTATCVGACWAAHELPRRPRATKSLSIPVFLTTVTS